MNEDEEGYVKFDLPAGELVYSNILKVDIYFFLNPLDSQIG